MTDNNCSTEELLRILIHLTARQSVPEATLRGVVGTGDKQRLAYNLADGTKSQREIAKAAKIDEGNFSRTVGRWLEEGVLFKLGEGREARVLHLYPLAAVGKAQPRKPTG